VLTSEESNRDASRDGILVVREAVRVVGPADLIPRTRMQSTIARGIEDGGSGARGGSSQRLAASGALNAKLWVAMMRLGRASVGIRTMKRHPAVNAEAEPSRAGRRCWLLYLFARNKTRTGETRVAAERAVTGSVQDGVLARAVCSCWILC